MKINTNIPVSDDPNDIKDHGIKLQNYFSEISRILNAAEYMLEQALSEKDRIKYLALKKASEDPSLKGKTIVEKDAIAKTSYRFNINIISPIKEIFENISDNVTYSGMKKIISLLRYRKNSAKSKYDEVKLSIEYCQYYPVKVY